ncbi:MAG: hypothetical protein BWY68_00022 [bacterium ADurb.Bin400]|nr:MAG: hypothetical protein BWY68_00022 [bacterium ADurb.Bin400]
MKIVICGSMSASKKMVEIKGELEKLGHEVILPKNAQEYADQSLKAEDSQESTKNKIENDLIRDYFHKISESDAVLVVNQAKNGIDGYVGGNSFLEMGFAHVLSKTIFLLNPIPQVPYADEIVAMQPVVLSSSLDLVK